MAVRELPKYESKYDNYILVDNTANFVNKFLKVDNVPERFALDTETYYNPALRAPQAISKWIKGGRNNCPFGASLYTGNTGWWVNKDLDALAPLTLCPDIAKVPHNSKYDINMLKNIGVEISGQIWDTMLMIHLIDEEFMCKYKDENGDIKFKKSKKLKDLSFHFLNGDAHELEDMVKLYRSIIASNTGRNVEDISYKEVDEANPILMKDYAIADTEYTYKLFDIFYPMLLEQDLLRAYETDMRATLAIIDVERQGVMVNRERMREDEQVLNKIIAERCRSAYAITGSEFRINSDAELVTEFGKLGLQWHWFTDKGELQTDKTVMKELQKSPDARIVEMAKLVLEYRKAEKILSTYITGVYPFIQEDGKVHPDFWVSPDDYDRGGTKTGRLSSSNPNLQNVTKKPVSLDLEEEGDEE